MTMFMKKSIVAAVAVATLGTATAHAEQYKDYTPRKGVWEIQQMEVDPNHVDEYLTGVRKSLISGFEVLKKRGLIDDYWTLSRVGYSKGNANILFGIHFPKVSTLEPDPVRDKAIEAEMSAAFSKEMSDKAVKGYEMYRKMLDDGFYTQLDFAK